MEGSAGFSGSAATPLLRHKGELAVPTLTSGLEIEYGEFRDEDAGDEAPALPILNKSDRVTLDILEMNTIFKGNANYDIEVYRIPNPKEEPNTLVRLNFINPASSEANFLMLQGEDPLVFNDPRTSLGLTDEMIESQFPILDETYVEYYLNLRLDTEIQQAPSIRSSTAYASGRPDDPAQICKDRPQLPAGWDRT